MSNSPIMRMLQFFVLILMVGIFCTIVFTVWDALDSESAATGDQQANYTSVSTNIRGYMIPFLGIILIGGFLYFLIGGGKGKQPEEQLYQSNQSFLGGNRYEY